MAEMIVVDDRERERIRQALEQYREIHNIGVPALADRMANALPRIDAHYLKWKSLQRFLGGKHRTEDEAVWRYKKFLERVAPPFAENQLGVALGKYFSSPFMGKNQTRNFAGRYVAATRPYQPERPAAAPEGSLVAAVGEVRPLQARQFDTPWSVLHLMQGDTNEYLRATEIFTDTAMQDSDAQESEDRSWLGNSGVFVCIGSNEFLMTVRSYLHTRLYLLKAIAKTPVSLRGTAFMPQGDFAPITDPSHAAWQPAFEIQFMQINPDSQPEE